MFNPSRKRLYEYEAGFRTFCAKLALWNYWTPKIQLLRRSQLFDALAFAVAQRENYQSAIRLQLQETSSWWWQSQLRKFLRSSEQTSSLAEAMKDSPHLFSIDAVAAVRAGEECGTLEKTLAVQAERLQRDASHDGRARSIQFLPQLFIGLFLVILMLSLSRLLVPQRLAATSEGFGVSLPVVSVQFFEILDSFLLALPWLLLAAGVSRIVWVRLRKSRRLPRLYPARLHLPGFLQSCGAAIAARRSYLGTTASYARWHAHRSFREKLSRALGVAEYGGSFWKALHSQRLLSQREGLLLDAAERAGNLQWAIEQLAKQIESARRQRSRLMLYFVEPLSLLLIAGAVTFVACALYLPLIKMIASELQRIESIRVR